MPDDDARLLSATRQPVEMTEDDFKRLGAAFDAGRAQLDAGFPIALVERAFAAVLHDPTPGQVEFLTMLAEAVSRFAFLAQLDVPRVVKMARQPVFRMDEDEGSEGK